MDVDVRLRHLFLCRTGKIIYLIWSLVRQIGTFPGCGESGGQSFFKFWDRIKLLDVNKFVFQASPQSLNEDIVCETALAVHADTDIMGL